MIKSKYQALQNADLILAGELVAVSVVSRVRCERRNAG